MAQQRLRDLGGVHLEIYDGEALPFNDGLFTHVMSSHIIEHTPSPRRYLSECVRVMAPGGALGLEFPTRFHWKELHTGLPSLEWLPGPLRDVALCVRHRPHPYEGGERRMNGQDRETSHGDQE